MTGESMRDVFLVVLCALSLIGGSVDAENCGNSTTDVIDMLTKQPRESVWIEGGFTTAGDQEWRNISTIFNTFENAVVFISLPEIDGETSNDGYPAIARVRNATTSGQISFEVKLYQANDSYCLKTWNIPEPIFPELKLSWIVAEQGAFNLTGNYFMIGEGPINRVSADVTNQSNFVRFDFPVGCESSTVSCAFEEGTSMGIILQLQDVVYDRLLIPRGYALRRKFARVVLQPHDSVDSSYYVMPMNEQLAYMAFRTGFVISCIEQMSFETHSYSGVTNTKLDIDYTFTYVLPPGVYGTVGTSTSLADSTGLRAFDRTVTGSSIITQEDQCYDEETIHTTGETVYVMIVGEQILVESCTVCKAVFTPDTTAWPTSVPTAVPTIVPTGEPSSIPSIVPTSLPSVTPSGEPSAVPSQTPTGVPSGIPSGEPSAVPSQLPTGEPSGSPSSVPSSVPSAMPTGVPSGVPSGEPTTLPTSFPSSVPTTSCPSAQPSRLPSALPTYEPTSSPTICTEVFNRSADVIDMISKKTVDFIWVEVGFTVADDQNWVAQSSLYASFVDPVVFVSLPEIPGETSNEGFPAITRIRNVRRDEGRVAFDLKLYQANDSYCSKQWSIPTPIFPAVNLSWMVVEQGAFNLSGYYFMAGSGPITRQNSDVSDQSNFVRFDYPVNCESSTVSCAFDEGASIGIILQLQTLVYDRLLIPRGRIVRRRNAILVLQPHDSSDSSYYVMTTPETLAYMAFEVGAAISCVERMTFETLSWTGVTNVKLDIEYDFQYTIPPGVYGTIGTSTSLADSTGLRAFARTTDGASIITQEDQCVDEETEHTTGETVYAMIVGEQNLRSSCTVCSVLFTPFGGLSVSPTLAPTSPSAAPSTSPSFVPTFTPTISAAPSISAEPTITSAPSICTPDMNGTSEVIDMIQKKYVENVWIEAGFASADDQEWTKVSSTYDSFVNPVVFVSLPEIEGETSNEGVPAIARVKNISRLNGRVEFDVKLYQANDSYCSKEWRIPIPISPPIDLAWIVVEQGAFNLSGHYFMIGSGPITRQNADVTNSSNFVRFDYPVNCDSATVSCEFSEDDGIGVILQIQTLVYDRLLIPRGVVVRRRNMLLVLQPHDSENPSYYAMTDPELLAYMVFETNIDISCVEDFTIETQEFLGVTNINRYIEYNYLYIQSPGVFGTVGSSNSLTDSTGLRSFDRTNEGASIITQEDQCVDEETDHTTGETVYTMVVGQQRSQSACVVCKALFTRGKAFTPTPLPTATPTLFPTSSSPSSLPTATPSSFPTATPSVTPSSLPTSIPSFPPTHQPTPIPTFLPSAEPTATPTEQPSFTPTSFPSGLPSSVPSGQPSLIPSSFPSSTPSTHPTSSPTAIPSAVPSFLPSGLPSSGPTSIPSSAPSSRPSHVPTTSLPSLQPTAVPSGVPSQMPSGLPTSPPTFIPSAMPSSVPSAVPTSCGDLPNRSVDVIDMIRHTPIDKPWMEAGFARADDQQWVTLSSTLDSFHDPVVFVSLPEIDGDTSSEGIPAIARVNNITRDTGRVVFSVKLYQANDSFCSKEWRVPVPISPAIYLEWMVVEQGAFNLSGHKFIIGSGPITRTNDDVTDQSNFVRFDYPVNCESSTISCAFDEGVPVGMILQLQTLVYDRLLIPRGRNVRRRNAVLVLQPHDSSDSSYYVMTTPETLAYMAFQTGISIGCIEGLSVETMEYVGVTNTKLDVNYVYSYTRPPGVYGTIGTSTSLADSTGLRAFARTTGGASIITQEDQCVDEETDHTTGEKVYTFVAGQQVNEPSCTLCGVVFTVPSAPTTYPTTRPPSSPSGTPTEPPSSLPSSCPSSSPSHVPSVLPTARPTSVPSAEPTLSPTFSPTMDPTQAPTAHPTLCPTIQPTSTPTSSPTLAPTSSPTLTPTTSPTCFPTSVPSASPTTSPTCHPTSDPTSLPTTSPTVSPSAAPTAVPTSVPSAEPTLSPTFSPTVDPTQVPTTHPSLCPTLKPTTTPTSSPTLAPTSSPTLTPTTSPTCFPTSTPSASPTTSPTCHPTSTPSASPTTSPTCHPTSDPTSLPTTSPTASPSAAPTAAPTSVPSAEPTLSPTFSPTVDPTQAPTTHPSLCPTVKPTTTPTSSPTLAPTSSPTLTPTTSPTCFPTSVPSASPTTSPTCRPTSDPTSLPTTSPTVSPSATPTASPTSVPSAEPTLSPTFSPTVDPTQAPTAHPSLCPTVKPTTTPTSSPTLAPTSSPTLTPTTSPTCFPTSTPSASPTTSPTCRPTSDPTSLPTTSPTVSPSATPTASPTSVPSAEPTLSPTFSPTVDPTQALSAHPSLCPTVKPTTTPTSSPTLAPTSSPTLTPTTSPTCFPTSTPSASPTTSPTCRPTSDPTSLPTTSPTVSPSAAPTAVPTSVPSAEPTLSPTFSPTVDPTQAPTAHPSLCPTIQPTTIPTSSPIVVPTSSPTLTPTTSPTCFPTSTPSATPTTSPTVSPSAAPTAVPTSVPSAEPTLFPTFSPTVDPTQVPTSHPSLCPTVKPTTLPTSSPTIQPTTIPTSSPTLVPTSSPTLTPTTSPTCFPTSTPSASPTTSPTCHPTSDPTSLPTTSPTVSPSAAPTASPTSVPSAEPTLSPTFSPTVDPTQVPTSHPSLCPTVKPTTTPTSSPTLAPTSSPTLTPTTSPTCFPTSIPSASPTTSPTCRPTSDPTSLPTTSPTASPSTAPTAVPTLTSTLPSTSPSLCPSFATTYQPTILPSARPSVSPSIEGATSHPTTLPSMAPTFDPVDVAVSDLVEAFNLDVQGWTRGGNVSICDSGGTVLSCDENGHLTYLDVRGSQISGTIPSSIGALTTLLEAYFSNNNIEGPLPLELGLLKNLATLDLGSNLLGTSGRRKLNELWSGHHIRNHVGSVGRRLQNDFVDDSFTAIQEMTSLKYLDISGNGFVGQIPSSLCALPLEIFVVVSTLPSSNENSFSCIAQCLLEKTNLALVVPATLAACPTNVTPNPSSAPTVESDVNLANSASSSDALDTNEVTGITIGVSIFIIIVLCCMYGLFVRHRNRGDIKSPLPHDSDDVIRRSSSVNIMSLHREESDDGDSGHYPGSLCDSDMSDDSSIEDEIQTTRQDDVGITIWNNELVDVPGSGKHDMKSFFETNVFSMSNVKSVDGDELERVMCEDTPNSCSPSTLPSEQSSASSRSSFSSELVSSDPAAHTNLYSEDCDPVTTVSENPPRASTHRPSSLSRAHSFHSTLSQPIPTNAQRGIKRSDSASIVTQPNERKGRVKKPITKETSDIFHL